MGQFAVLYLRWRRIVLLWLVLGLSVAGLTPARSAAASTLYCPIPATIAATRVVWVYAPASAPTHQITRACHKVSGEFVQEQGPYYGYVGRGGVAAAGAKREGDGRTPSGLFPLRGGFGIHANPGLDGSWFVTDAQDVWVDDPHSRLYNLHARKPAGGRWGSAEDLRLPGAYDYAQVIGYNETRTPGEGSAIFFHVSTGGPTAGCVSLPAADLVSVLRWERPGTVMFITRAPYLGGGRA